MNKIWDEDLNPICLGLMIHPICPGGGWSKLILLQNAYKFAKIAYFDLKFSANLNYSLYIRLHKPKPEPRIGFLAKNPKSPRNQVQIFKCL